MPSLWELIDLGQSVWLDNMNRKLILSGDLQRLIDEGVRGATANPTILDKAITGSNDYDVDIQKMSIEGRTAEEIYEALAIADIGQAADLFYSAYEATLGGDGLMSLEVTPEVAYDTQATIDRVLDLWNRLRRENVMIKVPATDEGMPAIELLTAEGINVNITLIFSQEQYQAVVEAYMRGLERRVETGQAIRHINSVASFFVSRVDTMVDKELEQIGVTELQGKIAIANAKVAYQYFQQAFNGDRWERLAAKGARLQRPLWASTSTKNPAYPDTMYVDELIGPHTVNTMPDKTLEAFLDHGHAAVTLPRDVEEAHNLLVWLNNLDIDLVSITDQLTRDGVQSFSDSYHHLLEQIDAKRQDFLGEQAA